MKSVLFITRQEGYFEIKLNCVVPRSYRTKVASVGKVGSVLEVFSRTFKYAKTLKI